MATNTWYVVMYRFSNTTLKTAGVSSCASTGDAHLEKTKVERR